MYTLGDIKALLVNEWYFLFIALFVYWILNSSLLVIVDTLCKKKFRNRVTANAVFTGSIPLVLIDTATMMRFVPMFNHWHIGINIILSLLSVVWMITVYYLFRMVREIRYRIMVKSPYHGWYLSRNGKVTMTFVMAFLLVGIVIKTLSYRMGIGSKVNHFRSVQMGLEVISNVHFHGPLPKWFISVVNFTLDCFILDSSYRINYQNTIGKQSAKEDVVKISQYLEQLKTVS